LWSWDDDGDRALISGYTQAYDHPIEAVEAAPEVKP